MREGLRELESEEFKMEAEEELASIKSYLASHNATEAVMAEGVKVFKEVLQKSPRKCKDSIADARSHAINSALNLKHSSTGEIGK